MALVYRRPEGIDAVAWVRRAVKLANACTDLSQRMNVYSLALWFHVQDSRLDEAENLRAMLRPLMASKASFPPLVSCAKAGEAFLHLLRCDLEACQQAIDQGLHAGRHHGATVFESILLAYDVHRALLAGDDDRALESLDRMAPLASAGSSYHRGIYEESRAFFRAHAGRLMR